MKTIRNLTIVAALVFISTMPCYAADSPTTPAKPWNFLVILLDDAGWRDLGFTGNDFVETPQLDRLAARSMVFKQGYATHPFCSPTRQSMVSGQWPARTAWQRTEEVNPRAADRSGPPWCPASAFAWTRHTPEFTSLAEALKSKGYRTAHIGKWHFAGSGRDTSPEAEGFDVAFGGSNTVGAVRDFFAPFDGLPGKVKSKPGEYLTDRLTDEALAFIRQNNNRPFFLQLWHYAPHEPIQAPKAIVEKYRKKRRELGNNQFNPTYAAMLECIDTGVGRIFAELKKLGLDDNTVILLASDNGGVASFGYIPVAQLSPLRGDKGMVYEGGIRVPIAVHWPGTTKPGATSGIPVSVLDFYPTILEIAGVPLPKNQPVDGVSLAPLLRGKTQNALKERPHFWYNVTSGVKEDGTIFQPVAAVRKGDWKLIKQFPDKLELYNLAKDPSESENLAEKQVDRAGQLEHLLDCWLKDTGVATPVPNPNYDPAFTISRQVPNDTLPADGKLLLLWKPGAKDGGWKDGQMIRTERIGGVLRMHANGGYPLIQTRLEEALAEGKYAVRVRLRVPTSGRIRFNCAGSEAGADVVEFNPPRDGEWHTLTGVFQTHGEVDTLTLAGPTHLKTTGLYDPAVHTDYIEVSDIALFKLP